MLVYHQLYGSGVCVHHHLSCVQIHLHSQEMKQQGPAVGLC